MARYSSFTARALAFLVFIWFLWFMTFTLRALFSPILPLIEDEFGITHARATSIFLFVSVGYSVSLFLSGAFASILGHRKAIITSIMVSGIVYLLIPLVKIFHLFFPLSLILGLAAGLYLPSIIPLITDYYAERLWDKAIAAHGSGPSIGIFCAPFIAIGILSFLPWRGVFLLVGAVMLLCAAIFYFVTEEVRVEKAGSYFIASILKKRAFWIIGAVWSFSAGCNLGLYLIFPLYLVKELSMDMGQANTILGTSRLGGAIFTLLAGLLVDHFSVKKGSFLLLLFTGIFTALLAVRDVRFVQILMFFQATISPTVFPLTLVLIPRLFPKEERGQATGFIVTLGVVGIGVIPYLLGLSGDLLSFRFGILMLGLVTILASGLVWLLREAD